MGPLHARWDRDGFTVTCDPSRIDRESVHAFLSQSYWARGIGREVVDRSIDGSLCFALLEGDQQIGFARVITDRATFAYLGDVHVLEARRGRGLGRWLMDCVMAHPDLAGLRRWVLVTRDAHELYAPLGFMPLANPAGYMELHRPDVYGNSNCTSSGTEKS
jgi:GNAT superfamily N-acetyltransferase